MTTKAQMAQIEGRAWEQALLDIKKLGSHSNNQ